MALTVPYAIRLANVSKQLDSGASPAELVVCNQALAPHGLKWMEEFLPPDNYDGYKDVSTQISVTC